MLIFASRLENRQKFSKIPNYVIIYKTLEVKMAKIIISENAIKKIAAYATIECYGVVGLAPKTFYDKLLRTLKIEEYEAGVDVDIKDNDTVKITLYVILQGGANVLEIANTIISQVSYKVKQLTKIKNVDVDVIIRGIKGEK